MIYRGCAVCRPNGVIIATYDWESVLPPEEVVGTVTWNWFSPRDREKAMGMFARAVIGEPGPAAILEFSQDRARGDLVCKALYIPTGEPTAPVLGAFSVFTRRALALSKRERQIAKMVPNHTSEEIARELGITRGAVDSQRNRIAKKLHKDSQSLPAFLAHLGSVL